MLATPRYRSTQLRKLNRPYQLHFVGWRRSIDIREKEQISNQTRHTVGVIGILLHTELVRVVSVTPERVGHGGPRPGDQLVARYPGEHDPAVYDDATRTEGHGKDTDKR